MAGKSVRSSDDSFESGAAAANEANPRRLAIKQIARRGPRSALALTHTATRDSRRRHFIFIEMVDLLKSYVSLLLPLFRHGNVVCHGAARANCCRSVDFAIENGIESTVLPVHSFSPACLSHFIKIDWNRLCLRRRRWPPRGGCSKRLRRIAHTFPSAHYPNGECE